MSDFNITGTVLHVGDTQVFSEKFQKRNLELETRGRQVVRVKSASLDFHKVTDTNPIVGIWAWSHPGREAARIKKES